MTTNLQDMPAHEAAEAVKAEEEGKSPATPQPIRIHKESLPPIVIVDEDGVEQVYRSRDPSTTELETAMAAFEKLKRSRDFEGLAEHISGCLCAVVEDSDRLVDEQPFDVLMEVFVQAYQRLIEMRK